MQRRILVTLAGLFAMTALIGILIAPANAQIQPSDSPPQVPLAQATAAPTVAPKPPVAVLTLLPVAANPADPNVITYTLVATTVVNTGASGLTNVSVGVPVHFGASVADPKNPAKKFVWTLTAPSASKAKLKDPAAMTVTEFTPDVVGVYKVDLVASNDGGNGPMASIQVHADSYIGVTAGNCKQCHPSKVEEWSKTGHASMLKTQLDTNPTQHYAETCIPCHTVGYNIGVNNGGFADVQAKTGWKFPTDQLGKACTFDAMPKELQNVSNIQCENCHGPATDHAKNGSPVMKVSLDEGVCNVCHNGGGHHAKGDELKNAKHSEEDSIAWNYPTGPDHQECVRCHSGNGYVS